MSDLISRQAAIDALDVLCQEHRYKIPGKRETYSQYNEAWQDALDRAEGAIFNLPPIQPEKRTETHACDLISRQAAIDMLEMYPFVEYEEYAEAREVINRLPSAQHEQKPGRWNFIGDNMFECTNCKVVYTTNQLNSLRNYDTDPYAPRFCPNCGAKMIEPQESEKTE